MRITYQLTMLRPLTRLSLMLWLLLPVGCNAVPSRFAANAPPGVATLSLMTYNVNFGVAGDRVTLDAIEQPGADLILLQEVNAAWERSLRERFGETYPHQGYHGDDGYAGGFAILSKWPIESIEQLPRVDWFPATRAIVRSPIGRVQVLNVHLRPPRSNSGSVVVGYYSTRGTREREISSYVSYLEPNVPTLIVGDFNESDGGRACGWLFAHGYQNALPQFSPRADTWRWPVGWFTLRARYDHIFYDASLYPLKAQVRNAGESDHLPVTGIFTLHDEMFPLNSDVMECDQIH